ncbi:MAG: tyrosine-type recombinase/integrase [Actinomycetota bacterium]|nr:tyrosine-type recombinase/integrase [Actinomycetota bacterium]
MRIGELLGLRLSDLDFLRRTVRVEHQSHSATRELVQLKSAALRRTIPLPAMVADALAAHLAQYPAGPDIECTCPSNAGCSRSASGLLFHTAGGTVLDQDYYGRRIFGVAVRRAGLPTGTTTHAMRQHLASVLLAAGESVVAVAEWLGHDNATLVLAVHGHLMANSEDRMRKAIDTAYGAAADSCAPTVPQRSTIML